MYLMYNRSILLLTFILSSFCISAQYKTEVLSENIHSLKVQVNQDAYSVPCIELGGAQTIKISFDELNSPIQNYYYKVEHCNADWTPSSISVMEWGNGFPENPINNTQTSASTTMSFSHYEFNLPNEDISFKYSGNYAVSIYNNNMPDKIIATACFSVSESKIVLSAKVHSNTLLGINTKYQQLDFDINTGSFPIENPMSDLKVTVKQNGRIDNQITNLQPTYISQNKLSYTNNKDLIFEGGNEYTSFDISSRYSFSGNIDNIKFFDPYFHVNLYPDKIAPNREYSFTKDINGKYIVNNQDYTEDEIFADYYLVHFSIPAEAPFFDGLVYILGDFNNNKLNDVVQMRYNNRSKAYEQTITLKQGGYNYQYVFVPKGAKSGSTLRIGGSHWQTENEYSIYVYYRPFGQRYDKLIACKALQSAN